MESSHVFYKELPVDKDNIFSANLAEDNEIEQIKFKKLKKYAMSGLSINQNTTLYVPLPNIEGHKALSNILRTYLRKKTSLTST